MQLTLYTDYGLRVLLYVGAKGEPATISEIAERYGISRNHIVKVVHNLGKLGYLETTRGRAGGVELAKDPAHVTVAEVVQALEPNFHIVECFNPEGRHCPIVPACRLKHVLAEAQKAFIDTLANYTLADMLANKKQLTHYLEPTPGR